MHMMQGNVNEKGIWTLEHLDFVLDCKCFVYPAVKRIYYPTRLVKNIPLCSTVAE